MTMTAEKPLTLKQRRVLDAFADLTEKLGMPPTLREVQEQLGFSSIYGVVTHTNRLVERGYLTRTAGISRGMKLTGKPAEASRKELLRSLAMLPLERLKELVEQECV